MISSFATPVATQFELAVGNAWVQLSATSLPCTRVLLMAPTARHPKGSPNTTDILVFVGTASPANTGGLRRIATDGTTDQWVHVTDAKLIWLRGFTAGDRIEACIEGQAQNLNP